MEINAILTLRIIQAVLAIIVLALSAFVIDNFRDNIDSANFLLFNSLWSFIALGYLVATPMYFPNLHNRWGVLGVEAITMVFWFAGFIALAADIPAFICIGRYKCPIPASKAAAIFGAFAWLAWLGTLGMVVNALIKNRKTDTAGTGTDGNETGITDPTGAPGGAAVLPSGTDVEMNGGSQFEKYEQQQPSEAPHLPQLSELGGNEVRQSGVYGHPPIDGSGTLEMPDVGQYGGNVTHVEQER